MAYVQIILHFWHLRERECKNPAVYLIFTNGQEFIFISSLSNLCLPLHQTCKPSKIYDIVAVFYDPKGTIYSQFSQIMHGGACSWNEKKNPNRC